MRSRTAATSRPIRRPACSAGSSAEWAGTGAVIATVVGRYYAMDRDHRAERTELARAALVDGVGERAVSASAAVEASYAKGLTDEFVTPVVLGDTGLRVARGDPLVFFNFRPDRARQICHALLPTLGLLVTMTRYDDTLGARVVFDDVPLTGTLADALAAAGLRQLHVAETEKYAHVTYFFDGGSEQRHAGEDWELVAVAARRPDLRPRARDGRRGRRTLLRRALSGRLRLRGRQPRQPRHGRAHGSPAGGDRRQSRPRMPRSA